MRLNGWLRVGIVLSLVWAVGAAIYQRNADVDRAEASAKFSHRICLETKALKHDTNLASCEREREGAMAIHLSGSWGNVTFMALAPVPLGWLAAFILFYAGRAQVVGFRAVVPWATLTLPKKAFVIGCLLASLIVALFGVLVVLNLQLDKQVPVIPGGGSQVTDVSDDVVFVKGTWMQEGLTEATMLGFPLQTSEIKCFRGQQRCEEARALVSGNVLLSELVEYEIESWSATTIVFKDERLCYSSVFTIDRKTETVNGVGRPINTKEDYCKRLQNNIPDKSVYRLTDGFKIYWEQRQKARPFPLRLIQALFGN